MHVNSLREIRYMFVNFLLVFMPYGKKQFINVLEIAKKVEEMAIEEGEEEERAMESISRSL
jgi:hypothetical protein